MPITRNFGPLDQIPLTTAALMRDVGLLARERIVRRTRQGIGTDGTAFRPLSAAYARRKGSDLGHSRADLTVSGGMLNAITLTRVTEDAVDLGFSS